MLLCADLRACSLAGLDTEGGEQEDEDKSFHHSKSTLDSQAKTKGLAVYHPDAGHYTIAPIVDGRIVNVTEL